MSYSKNKIFILIFVFLFIFLVNGRVSAQTDTTPPTVLSLDPADNATNVTTRPNVSAVFDETVVKGGFVYIKRVDNGEIVGSFRASSTNRVKLSTTNVTNDTLNINWINELETNTEYYIVLTEGSVTDTTGNPFAGLGVTDTTAWSFTTGDYLEPQVMSLTPPDNDNNADPDASFVAQFDEDVQAGTGNITLYSGSQVWALEETFDVTSNLTITSVNEFSSDGGGSFFGINFGNGDGTGNWGGGDDPTNTIAYTGFNGNYFDASNTSTTSRTLDWDNIPINGLTNLAFSADFAAPAGWGGDDFVRVLADINNSGSFTEILEFRGDGDNIPREELDGVDAGLGDGVPLTTAAKRFHIPISGTGNTLDLRIIVRVSSGGQRFAADNVVISGISNTPTTVEQVAIGAASVTISGNTLTYTPTATLSDLVEHFIIIDDGAITDTSTNANALNDLTASSAWNFATGDYTAPTIVTLNPADDATGVSRTPTLSITFNETVQADTGNITLHRTSDGAQVASFDVTSDISLSTDTVVNDTVSFSVSGILAGLTEYYVLIPVGAVTDAVATPNAFAGITDTTAWSFTTTNWTTTGSLTTARHGHTATLLPDGKVLVVGGRDSSDSTLNSAELYDPTNGTWTTTGILTSARSYHTATLLPDGKVLITGGSGSSGASAELYDPADGTWTTTGALTAARYWHTATLLPDGKVLVTGGFNGNALNSAELYDPSDGSWTATVAPMSTARYLHTATLLPDGKVLVAGGYNSGVLNSAELYDPTDGSWASTDSLTTARYAHTATLLPDGKVLVAGGSNGFSALNSAELYDPTDGAGAWSATGTLTTARDSHTATLLPNGKVLVTGGSGSSGASAELYDPADGAGAWSTTGALTAARYLHTATLLPDGKVLVTGGFGSSGASAELYDPADSIWSTTSDLTNARSWHTATLLPDDKVLVTGGAGSSGASAELYNPASGSWTPTSSMTTTRSLHTATLLPDGKVLVVGGSGSSGASAELYNPASGAWSSTGSLTTARSSHTATLLPDGKVLVTGGYNSVGFYLNSAELYDPADGTWMTTDALTTARYWHTATLLPDGKVLVTGGNNGSTLNSTELYDPIDGSWTTTGSLPTARYAHTATLLPDGKVLVTGGRNSSVDALNSANLYDPTSGSWTSTDSLTSASSYHTATLLPGGKVLVTGGNGNSAELYDPASGNWSTTDSMASARGYHTATLLPDGKVLVTGGWIGLSYLSSAELYDSGLGFAETRRPVITTVNDPANVITPTISFDLTGSGFQGDSTASSGGANASPTNYPLIQIRHEDSERTVWTVPLIFSDTAYSGVLPANFPPGPARVTLFVNGIPSLSARVTIANDPPTAVSGGNQIVETAQTVTLDGSGSTDADSDLPLTYGWVQTDGSAVILSSATAISPTFTAPTTPAVLTFTLTVTDSFGLASTPSTAVITVNDVAISGLAAVNDSPTVLGQTTTLTATTDTGSNIVYSWDLGDGTSGSGATITNTYGVTGSYTATITATNGTNTQITTTLVTINDEVITGLTAVNDSPTVLGQATTLTASVTTGSNVSYSWDLGDGTSGSGATIIKTYGAAGSYTATVTATNSINTQVTTTTVTITNDAPTADAGGNQTVETMQAVTLDGGGSTDSDGHTPLTYGWTQTGGTSVVLSRATAVSPTFTALSTPTVLTFTLTVTDSYGLASTPSVAVITINDVAITGLTAVNDSPTALGQTTMLTATADTGSNIVYNWDLGDGTSGSGATITKTYSAAGSYTATVTATNGTNTLVATAPVTITNQAPVANAGTATVLEDNTLTDTLSATDINGDALTYTVVSTPTFGNATITDMNTGDFTYIPVNRSATYTDTFTFQANDGTADSNTASFTITVTADNDAPIAADASESTDEDTILSSTLDAVDLDTDDSLSYSVDTAATDGLAAIDASGLWIYTPTNRLATYMDTFVVLVSDSGNLTDTATITITVTADNDAPTAVDNSYTIPEDSSDNVLAVLGNDNAIDIADSLLISDISSAVNGTAVISDTAILYTPMPDFVGTDIFTYTIQDGGGLMDTAMVTVTVTNVNDAPTAVDDSYTIPEDSSDNVFAVLDNDNDIDIADSLLISDISSAMNGSAVISGTAILYTPTPDFFGTDTFTYTIQDSGGLMDTAMVTVTVTNVNDAPTADAGGDQTVETNLSVTLDGSGSTDSDGHTPLTYGWTQTSGPAVSLSNATAVSPSFTAPANAAVLTFALVVTDSAGLPGTADEVAITVQEPGLAAQLTAMPTTARPGGVVWFTLTLTNTGELTLSNLASVTTVGGNFTLPGSIAAGVAASYTYSYTVLVTDLPDPLTNVVTVTAQTPLGGDVSAMDITAVVLEPYTIFLPVILK